MARRAVRRRRKGGTENAVILVGGTLIGGMIFALPTSMLIYFGMLPTVVALIVDQQPGKYATRCVAGLNFAGLIPYLMVLWIEKNTLHGALSILTDVYAWLAIYGTAAIGWMLYFGLPPIIGSFTAWYDEQRILSLRNRQRQLVRDWGEEVAGDHPLVK